MELQSNSLTFNKSPLKDIIIMIFFVFLILLILPIGNSNLFHLKDGIHFQDIFLLTTYLPHFISAPEWGWESFINIGIAFNISLVTGSGWYFFSRNSGTQLNLFYWLHVIARYRLAFGIIGYGMIKLFPIQFADPSLSDLNTAYGDFLPWKIYYLTLGYASAAYEPALGLLEILGAILLLHRKTAVFGAGLLSMFLINIVAADFAYQLGNHVYSIFLLILAIIVLAPYLAKLYRLLILRKPTKADSPFKVPATIRINKVRVALKVVFSLFILIYGTYTFAAYKKDNWPYPNLVNQQSFYGLYNVKEFRLNGTEHPYNSQDKIRWKDVVFEKWNSISIRKNEAVAPDLSIGKVRYADRRFEHLGNAGRSFYNYTIDTLKQTITLQNESNSKDTYQLQYQLVNSQVQLSGINSQADSITVVLELVKKKYLLNEGRRKTNQKF